MRSSFFMTCVIVVAIGFACNRLQLFDDYGADQYRNGACCITAQFLLGSGSGYGRPSKRGLSLSAQLL